MSSASTASIGSGLIWHLVDPAVRSLAIACLVAAVLKLARMMDSAARLAVWRGILYLALAMPLMAWLMPGIPLPLPQVLAPPPARNSSPPPVFRTYERVSAPRANDVPIEAAPLSPAPARERRDVPWPVIADSIYFLVAGYFLARLCLGVVFSHRIRRSSRRINDAATLAILEEQAAGAGLRRTPHLAESEKVSVPVTMGARRPMVLLPATWREWKEPKLRAVLAHELSHVARNDALTQMLGTLHRCVFWFSPLGWWLERHLSELAEQASDDAALGAVPDRTYYAEVLLSFLGDVESARGRIHWQGVSMAKGARVERRVNHILNARTGLLKGLKKPVWVGVLMVAMPLACLVAAVRPELRHKSEGATAGLGVSLDSGLAKTSLGVQRASAFGLGAPARVGQHPATPPAPPAIAATPAIGAPPAIAAPPSSPRPPIAPKTPKEAIHWADYSDDNEGDESFVIVSGDSINMSGSPGEMRHAKLLRDKIAGDYIWFRHDDKGYVIRDAATVRQAKELFAPQEALGRQQEELGKKQEELGRQQEALGRQMEQVRVKVPDMTAELKSLQTKLVQLRDGGTQEELGRAQEALGELQARLGELQGQAGEQQGKLGAQQGQLGEQQGKLGEQQGRLGEEQGRLAREATRKLRLMFDEAVKKGLAQPE